MAGQKISGRVILAHITGSGKSFKLHLATKYGNRSFPIIDGTKENANKKAHSMILQIIPKSDYIGMSGSKAIYEAPMGWKGGING